MAFYRVGTKIIPLKYPAAHYLAGETAKSIFERAQLPNEILGRIWTLADTEQKGALGLTEFIIAMHLLASMKNGSMRAVPQILPAGLYEAAARRGVPRQGAGSRPTSDGAPPTIPRQFSGAGFQGPQRIGTGFQQPTPAGDQWLITPQDKNQFDSIFATIDPQNRGYITGDQAVGFFSNSRLPEEALAQIWDLADINSEGQLNRDEFAVAMYLIRQQRTKTSGREVLPQQLPPNLIPPSMRRQPIAPQQPTAPAFDNAANISAPKSASEDLFGLDAISSGPTSAPIQAKSTGDSSVYGTPPRTQSSPPPTSAPTSAPTSHFKPFIPSSSFGQAIMTPQGTGTSGSTSPALSRGFPSQQKQGTAMDDLLGDNDPEVSKKLTAETSDFANLSNQVSTLTGQMQETKNTRGVTEQQLSQAQSQKAQFEARLSELRSAYEQEVREVRALEERLVASRTETKKLQSDIALIQGTHEDLKNQHRQTGEALSSDQTENTGLKEKIRQINMEIEQLKPQLEKLRSDARHQKGLVAINKKQLATHEAEREKTKGEMQGASDEHAEAVRDLEQSQRELDSASQTRAPAAAVESPAPGVSSPTPSMASLNPFFRGPANPPSTERGLTSLPFTAGNVTSPNHNAFDSFFGPSAATATPPPATSFRSETPQIPRESTPIQNISSQPEDGASMNTPSASPPHSNFSDSPVTASEPPAPPKSRQITSSFLPLRPKFEHSGSETSSVKVMPPASRAGESAETPTYAQSEATIPESPKQHFQEMAAQAPQAEHLQLTPPSSQQTPEIMTQETTAPMITADTTGFSGASREVPGAFPGDETPLEKSEHSTYNSASSPYSSSVLDPRVDSASQPSMPAAIPTTLLAGTANPFAKSNTPTSAKDDFDSAFEGFSSGKGKAPEERNGTVTDDPFGSSTVQQSKGEFPPIKELAADDDSDSDSEKGFEDDFSARSAQKKKESSPNEALQGQGSIGDSTGLAPMRPAFTTTDSDRSQLPTPGAQASPPTYDQTVGSPPAASSDRKGSFPAEYSGLLPSRDDPTSMPALSPQTTVIPKSDIASSAGIDRGLNFFPGDENTEQAASHATAGSAFAKDHSPMSPGASTSAPYAYTRTSSIPQLASPQPVIPAKAAPPKDDFDDFEDLAPAQEEDEKGGEDTLDFSRQNTDLDFNPTFDSPTISHTQGPSQSSSAAFPPAPSSSDAFTDFQSSTTSAATVPSAAGQKPAPTSHDWDAIFAGLDTPRQQQSNGAGPELPPRDAAFPTIGKSVGGNLNGVNSTAGGGAGGKQDITADDDPILKRLIGMGFARGDSLAALERYDYNIDKVMIPSFLSFSYFLG